MTTDSADLHDYCSTGSETAFRRMVDAHAPMVHGVAVRMLRNPSLAEEVTQSVFVILAQKARSVPAAHLAGWLHNTATAVARNAGRKEARRSALNQQYTQAMDIQQPTAESWEIIAPHLDEAVARLTHEDRQLMVLRFFEQRNFREISTILGCSEEACKKRAQRALERLGTLLRKRGVTACGPLLGTAVASFALLPPTASSASISTVALSSAGKLAGGGAPSLFKLIQAMTTKQVTTVATVSTFNFIHAVPPLLALALGAIWTVSQHREIDRVDHQTAIYQHALDTLHSNPGISGSENTRTVGTKKISGRIDWKNLDVSDRLLQVAVKRRMAGMTTAELLSQLDEIDMLDVPNRARLQQLVFEWLVNKGPRELLERYPGRLGDEKMEQTLSFAFESWSSKDPGEAAKWLDRNITEGAFNEVTLDGRNPKLDRYELTVISHLLASDPQAALARVETVPKAERMEFLQNVILRGNSAPLQVNADLIRASLPREQWGDVIRWIQEPDRREAMLQALEKSTAPTVR